MDERHDPPTRIARMELELCRSSTGSLTGSVSAAGITLPFSGVLDLVAVLERLLDLGDR